MGADSRVCQGLQPLAMEGSGPLTVDRGGGNRYGRDLPLQAARKDGACRSSPPMGNSAVVL